VTGVGLGSSGALASASATASSWDVLGGATAAATTARDAAAAAPDSPVDRAGTVANTRTPMLPPPLPLAATPGTCFRPTAAPASWPAPPWPNNNNNKGAHAPLLSPPPAGMAAAAAKAPSIGAGFVRWKPSGGCGGAAAATSAAAAPSFAPAPPPLPRLVRAPSTHGMEEEEALAAELLVRPSRGRG
jgi:hypothetical protein